MSNSFVAQALAELARWEAELLPLIVAKLGEEKRGAVQAALPVQLKRLLQLMPDPGWSAPQMRAFSIGGAIYIAVYLVLKPYGLTAAQAWEVCEQATRSRFAQLPALTRWLLGKATFSPLWKLLNRHHAGRSRQQAIGGWQFEYLPSRDGEYDHGINYTRCAIFQLAQDAGAADFSPYICQADAVMSDIMGWGLKRTETLAQGGRRCDFRFRPGQASAVRFRLPVLRPSDDKSTGGH